MRYKTATQWGVYHVEVVDGQVRAVDGISEDPEPSGIGQALLDSVTHSARVQRPRFVSGWLNGRDRDGRGREAFVDVPWG